MTKKPIKAMVVDDDLTDRMIYSRYLDQDAEVFFCSGFDEAVSLAKENKFDLIFVDYRLPGYLGTSLIKELKGQVCSKIYLVSGGRKDTIDFEEEAVCVPFLSKDDLSHSMFSEILASLGA